MSGFKMSYFAGIAVDLEVFFADSLNRGESFVKEEFIGDSATHRKLCRLEKLVARKAGLRLAKLERD